MEELIHPRILCFAWCRVVAMDFNMSQCTTPRTILNFLVCQPGCQYYVKKTQRIESTIIRQQIRLSYTSQIYSSIPQAASTKPLHSVLPPQRFDQSSFYLRHTCVDHVPSTTVYLVLTTISSHPPRSILRGSALGLASLYHTRKRGWARDIKARGWHSINWLGVALPVNF